MNIIKCALQAGGIVVIDALSGFLCFPFNLIARIYPSFWHISLIHCIIRALTEFLSLYFGVSSMKRWTKRCSRKGME